MNINKYYEEYGQSQYKFLEMFTTKVGRSSPQEKKGKARPNPSTGRTSKRVQGREILFATLVSLRQRYLESALRLTKPPFNYGKKNRPCYSESPSTDRGPNEYVESSTVVPLLEMSPGSSHNETGWQIAQEGV